MTTFRVGKIFKFPLVVFPIQFTSFVDLCSVLTRAFSTIKRMSVEVTEAAAPGKFYRRDHLVDIEKKVQQKWKKLKAFETDAPIDGAHAPKGDKFMVTFPYPYMNGRLH